MPTESWLALSIAVTWLLAGGVGVLAWAVYRRIDRAEQLTESQCRTLGELVRKMEIRLTELESTGVGETRPRGRLKKSGLVAARGSFRPLSSPSSIRSTGDSSTEPRLIAVPSLEPSQNDRDVSVNGLKERHAAIWALADSGAAPEVIARATAQPIGQIEVILGLRRHIDATRTNISHGPHA